MTKKTPEKQEKLSHPFAVGQEYCNRDGTYHVVSINEPDMVIRYQDGRTVASPIVLQARIWENIQVGDGDELEVDL